MSLPAWDGEDFSLAFRTRFIDGVIPLSLASLSLLLLVSSFSSRKLFKVLRKRRRRKRDASPALIIESEYEYEANDSRDVMLEAENDVIREAVRRGDIVWPGALKALGLLSEKENHLIKPDPRKSKHLQVPLNGDELALRSQKRWWRLGVKGNEGRSVRRRRQGWRHLPTQIVKKGKTNFVQAILAWAVTALLLVKAIYAPRYIGWVFVPGSVWVYFTILLEVRQYSAILRNSPFRPAICNVLSYHFSFYLLIYSIITLLDLRSTILHHSTTFELGIQASVTSLSILILIMEVFTPRNSQFIRKARLKADREASVAQQTFNGHSHGQAADENTALLTIDISDELDDDEQFMAALDLLPESKDVSSRQSGVKVTPPPEIGTSLFALATFTYIGSFIFRHARVPATLVDVPDLRADDKSASVILEFRASCKTFPRWLRPRSKGGLRKRPPIFLQICWFFRSDLVIQCLWAFLTPWFTVLPPIFLRLLLEWATGRGRGQKVQAHVAMLYVAGLFCAQMAISLCRSRSLLIGRRLSIRARALVVIEVFTKTLRRKDLAGKALVDGENKAEDAGAVDDQDGEGPASAGRIQNLVSVDASRIAELFAYIHFFLPEAPLSIVIAMTLLVNTIGYSAFAAVGTMLLLIPFQTVVARFFMRYQNQLLSAADDRLSLTTEVFQAIKILKFFAWEEKFNEKLREKREAELTALKKRIIVFATGGIPMFGAPTLIALITFIFHTKVFHQPLDATTAFTALALFNVIRSPLEIVADQLSTFLSTLISCRRIDSLLDEEETAKYAVIASPTTASDPKIGFVNAAFTWADADSAVKDSNIFKLQNLNLRFVLDGLNIVAGPVGAGKSSLLYALLGEMNLLNGRCFLPNPIVRETGIDPATSSETVAFCAQMPWLLNDSIRNNILFGSAYNAKRYKQVLSACALVPDLAVLDAGDKTEVGEKGTVLSGGQKARISLARAIYSSAKVLLLDDILSAVDAHTARHLYHHCLTSDSLMRGRTRILVTHALHLTLPLADYVVALSNGSVAFDGPSHDYVTASGANTPGISTGQNLSNLFANKVEILQPPIDTEEVGDAAAEQTVEEHYNLRLDDNPLQEEILMVKSEKQSVGAVSLDVYTFYTKACGSLLVLSALVTVIVATEIAAVGSNWALRLWASSFDNIDRVFFTMWHSFIQVSLPIATEQANQHPDHYLKIYVALACLALLLFGIRMLFFLWRGLVGSRVMYVDLIESLLQAPVRFYDTTPIGRIMNRLSKDMETIDQEVPSKTMFFVLEVFGTGAVVVAIALAVPAFLLAGIVVSLGYCLLGWLYISTSRELKRIEAVTRSPVFGLVGECLMGVTSIRAYSDASRFTAQLLDLVDATNRPFFSLWLTNRWLSVRSDLGGALVALITATFIVAIPSISASLAGFALTYALLLEERILWIVRLYATTQINMNSVERVREYTLELPQETKLGAEPPAYWPSRNGSIRVEKLVVRYADDLQPALSGVSFEVKPSERVAIVGRTGSGKSTLALSFFRFVEASQGSIIIDGIDISTIPLNTLRDRLTIIPQEAALFAGTVRFNLDPFSTMSDSELYDVLKRTNVLSSGSSTPGGNSGINRLDDHIQEGAKNFSAGQRQLICLARGLLKMKNSSVLILDESTANLDHDTDVAVQQTIREEMGDATILCIAHRIHTIIDFDRVLVLGQGKVLEFDTPVALLAKEESEFYKLCKESGDLETLKELAEAHSAPGVEQV